MTPRRWRQATTLLAAVLALQYLAGCSGVSPTKTGPPPDGGACGSGPAAYRPLNGALTPVGTDTTLDVACWNLLNFPSEGDSTVKYVAEIINTLNLDVLAVQEIADTTAFKALLSRTPGYAGLFSPDTYGRSYQKTGVIYRTDVVSVDSVRVPAQFKANSYYFASRPPIDVALTTSSNGRSYSFHLIVVHLKAGKTNAEDAARREAATTLIKAYIDQQMARLPGVKYVVAGDWNDSLDGAYAQTTFKDFLAAAGEYRFLTAALIGDSYMASHPLGLIDNIMVNSNACPDFSKGRVTVLRLDLIMTRPAYWTSVYLNFVSDHRPVLAAAPVFK